METPKAFMNLCKSISSDIAIKWNFLLCYQLGWHSKEKVFEVGNNGAEMKCICTKCGMVI